MLICDTVIYLSTGHNYACVSENVAFLFVVLYLPERTHFNHADVLMYR